MNSNCSLSEKFDGNHGMRKQGEHLLLRLFTQNDVELRRVTYRLAATKMATFLGNLMNGKTFISKPGTISKMLGLPLTIDILIEIVLFGLSNTDQLVICATNFKDYKFFFYFSLFISFSIVDIIKC